METSKLVRPQMFDCLYFKMGIWNHIQSVIHQLWSILRLNFVEGDFPTCQTIWNRKYLGNFQIYAFISEVSDQSFKLSTFVIYNSGVVHESNVFCTTIFDTHTIKTKSYSWGKVEQVGMLTFCFIFYSLGILKAGICHLLIITQPLYN